MFFIFPFESLWLYEFEGSSLEKNRNIIKITGSPENYCSGIYLYHYEKL